MEWILIKTCIKGIDGIGCKNQRVSDNEYKCIISRCNGMKTMKKGVTVKITPLGNDPFSNKFLKISEKK